MKIPKSYKGMVGKQYWIILKNTWKEIAIQKIIPHLWYDHQAKEAAEFYSVVFPNSKVTQVTTIHNTPSGDSDIVSFKVNGHEFMAISAGPLFKLNPSISFMVNVGSKLEIDKLWADLSRGGKVLMELAKYPFSEYYGWIQDKYGVSWQLMLINPDSEMRPYIVPSLLFVKEMRGKAKQAVDYYLSLFSPSHIGRVEYYPDKTLMFSDFNLLDQWFVAMDGEGDHEFKFNEAISLMVKCDNQAEIDTYWSKLSAVPESEQCGWLKDKYGVSWQIVPTAMDEMMSKGTPEQIARVTQAFLKMKKFDIAVLEKAFEEYV
jgi:predicted 3-demethylubiquinone-9 3-methyltransferase (glyoxalase superfamily)